jgi:tRNA nucleotidyltransferase (CCA-adding enzyme)
VPNEVRDLALTAARSRAKLRSTTPGALLDLFKTADAFRRPERFTELLEVARSADTGIDAPRIERALRAAASVDAGAIAAKAAAPAEIPKLLDQARLTAIGEA